MVFDKEDRYFDYYKIDVPMGTKAFTYCFEVRVGKLTCFYDKMGVSREIRREFLFQLVPDWAKGAVMYQIFVDRFNNGDKTNDVEDREYFYIGDMVNKVTDWDKCPAYMGIR